jgi:hypothetical protein
MLKRRELTDPTSCMSRAKSHEMTFVLLARDEAAPQAIRVWAAQRIFLRKNRLADDQIAEALECARVMEDQRSGIKLQLEAERLDLSIAQPEAEPIPDWIAQNAPRMWRLIRDFALCETSQTSYAELKGSQSMDIPVEFLALCEFAEEMGVKLP